MWVCDAAGAERTGNGSATMAQHIVNVQRS